MMKLHQYYKIERVRQPIQTFLIQSKELDIEAYGALMPRGRVYVQHISGAQKLEIFQDLTSMMGEFRALQEMAEFAPLSYMGFYLKTYRLVRLEDFTGISGIGVVAHGVQFPTGNIVQEWTMPPYGIGMFNSLSDMLEVHGHEGRTIAEFNE